MKTRKVLNLDPKTMAALTEIAEYHLGAETLETRGSDGLDFHDVSAEGIRRALITAFLMGKESEKAQ